MIGTSAEACLLNDSVWLSQVSFSNAEEAFYCSKFGTESNSKQRTKSPGPVHFDSSANKKQQQSKGNKQNRNRKDSKSPHQQQRFVTNQNGYSGNMNYNNHLSGQYHQQYQHNYHQNGGPPNGAVAAHYQQQQHYYYGGPGGGAGGGAKYYRNNQYYSQYNQQQHPHYQHQQFGELKQHIAQARQTIQRALRHSGSRNSGGGNWGEGNNRRSGSRNSTGGGDQQWHNNNSGDGNNRPRRNSNRNSNSQKSKHAQANANRSNNSESHNNRNSFSKRKRTVSFEDTVSGEITGRIKQLEEENEQLHKVANSLEGQVGLLLDRVKVLEAAVSGKENGGKM